MQIVYCGPSRRGGEKGSVGQTMSGHRRLRGTGLGSNAARPVVEETSRGSLKDQTEGAVSHQDAAQHNVRQLCVHRL